VVVDMKYMGSKNRISGEIIPFIQEVLDSGEFEYIEPFVGGANLIDKIENHSKIGSDINVFLINMWQRLQLGWSPRVDISKEEYSKYRDLSKTKDHPNDMMAEIGFIGFICSYGGRFYDGGYANISGNRNYQQEAYRNIMKQVPDILDVKFIFDDYRNLKFNSPSVIYCDIPYKGTKEYTEAGFDHEYFYSWVKERVKEGHHVFISEFYMPDEFSEIWKKEVKSSLNKENVKVHVEKLFYLGDYDFNKCSIDEWL